MLHFSRGVLFVMLSLEKKARSALFIPGSLPAQ